MIKKVLSVLLGISVVLAGVLWFLSSFKPVMSFFSVEEIDRLGKASGMTDCFWFGHYSENSGVNYAYPDTGANYWTSQFKLPAGAKLDFDGQFPHARHMSFNTYDELGQPADRLNDTMFTADNGSINPFVVGMRRDGKNRAYRFGVVPADVSAGANMAQRDAQRPPNTLYVPQDGKTVQLMYRIYVQDHGLTPKGGVELPSPRMTLANGTTVRGEDLCKSIVIKEHSLRDNRLTLESTQRILSLANSATPHHPAFATPQWTAFFNPQRTFSGVLKGTAFEWVRHLIGQQRKGGFYSTLDNTYMYAYVDRRFGDALVLEGQGPSTPKTRNADPVMQAGQLRYWSICKYRSLYDTAVDACVYDEQAPLDHQGKYTIVFSTPETRPTNARPECGVAWRPWGIGDGVANPHGGLILLRNMLPAPDFKHSIFAAEAEGTESEALGPYYPRPSYAMKAAFEARGCPVSTSN